MNFEVKTLENLAKYHEEKAAYGGAGREFHERATSACSIAIEAYHNYIEVCDRLKMTARILIEEIGANGPKNAEVTAREAVSLIKQLRTEITLLANTRTLLLKIAEIYNTWFSGDRNATEALFAIGRLLEPSWNNKKD